jgi:hypothetical protein
MPVIQASLDYCLQVRAESPDPVSPSRYSAWLAVVKFIDSVLGNNHRCFMSTGTGIEPFRVMRPELRP